MDVKIGESWKAALAAEFSQPYFKGIVDFLKEERAAGKIIYPPGQQIFKAFDATPADAVKVVLLGQDPYHNKGQAQGLSFSVPQGVHPPPSLVNIFKELVDDTGIEMPTQGNLEPWAEQGVLLLNAALTVEAHQPNSHAKAGWHRFTDAVIKWVSDEREHCVFILWGKFAQGKELLINQRKHLILKAAHPSPFSAMNGFFGSRPFSKTNHWLEQKGLEQIDWALP